MPAEAPEMNRRWVTIFGYNGTHCSTKTSKVWASPNFPRNPSGANHEDPQDFPLEICLACDDDVDRAALLRQDQCTTDVRQWCQQRLRLLDASRKKRGDPAFRQWQICKSHPPDYLSQSGSVERILHERRLRFSFPDTVDVRQRQRQHRKVAGLCEG